MVPIAERHAKYANKVAEELRELGIRVHVDARSEKMNAKIREHTMQKIPFLLVVGDKEAADNAVSVRTRGKGDEGSVRTQDFVQRIKKLVESKSVEL
jgi:threonyl-tRNA synthetase